MHVQFFSLEYRIDREFGIIGVVGNLLKIQEQVGVGGRFSLYLIDLQSKNDNCRSGIRMSSVEFSWN